MFAATLLASLALVAGQTPEEPALILRGHPPGHAVFSHDGKRLAVVAQGIEVYDVATGKLTLRIPHVFGDVSFSPDGRLLASAGWDCDVRVWNVPAK